MPTHADARARRKADAHRMKRGLWIGLGAGALIIGAIAAHGQELPDAPKPQARKSAGENRARTFALYAVAAGRTGDLITTERCNHVAGCREGETGQAMADSYPAQAAFEAGATVAEWLISNHVAKRHPRIALVGDLLSGAAIWATVGHNLAVQSGRPNVGTFRRY